jgi:hypothetical protein
MGAKVVIDRMSYAAVGNEHNSYEESVPSPPAR